MFDAQDMLEVGTHIILEICTEFDQPWRNGPYTIRTTLVIEQNSTIRANITDILKLNHVLVNKDTIQNIIDWVQF